MKRLLPNFIKRNWLLLNSTACLKIFRAMNKGWTRLKTGTTDKNFKKWARAMCYICWLDLKLFHSRTLKRWIFFTSRKELDFQQLIKTICILSNLVGCFIDLDVEIFKIYIKWFLDFILHSLNASLLAWFCLYQNDLRIFAPNVVITWIKWYYV